MLSTEALAVFSASFINTCSAVYMVFLHRDYKKLRKIDVGVYENVYTLSTRFQLAENLRVMKVSTLCISLYYTNIFSFAKKKRKAIVADSMNSF